MCKGDVEQQVWSSAEQGCSKCSTVPNLKVRRSIRAHSAVKPNAPRGKTPMKTKPAQCALLILKCDTVHATLHYTHCSTCVALWVMLHELHRLIASHEAPIRALLAATRTMHALAHSLSAARVSLLTTTHSSLLTTRYSLLTTHYTLLATRYSLLSAHYSLLTTHYSLLTTHYSLLTTKSVLRITHYSLLTPCYATLQYAALHYTTLHYTALHYTTLRCTTLHYITLHCTTLHYTTLLYSTLCYAMPRPMRWQLDELLGSLSHRRSQGASRLVPLCYCLCRKANLNPVTRGTDKCPA